MSGAIGSASNTSRPAPAHKACKTQFISIKDANKRPCGEVALANKRVINQFIHPDVVETCQLCMGLTALDEGSVWNSMPPHNHERRMEIYFYFEVPENQVFSISWGKNRKLVIS